MPKLKNWRARDSYYSEDYEDDTDEMNEIEDFFCVTLNNMSKEDAKFYGKTYGLFIRPNRKGYDLAGNEDQVRAMLEDYIGRYDEIGKIMSEGWYVPDWNRERFVNPHKRYADSKKDLKHYQITYTYEGQKDTFETYAEDEKEAIKDLKKGYDEDFLKIKSVKVLDKKVKDSDPWHEVAQYELTFEDGHKERDTIPMDVKIGYSDEDILDYFQGYYDDKIVKVEQIGWSRMGDKKSKKVKDSDEPMYFGLFQRGGSIGQNSNAEYRRYGDGILIDVYLDRDEAKEDAKRYRKNLTPGERSYYGMGYTVKPLNKSDLKHPYVQKLINELANKSIKDSVEEEVTEGHKEALEEYLEWEGIIGYDEDIIECYESGCAWVDDDFKDYEDSYDALDAYLTWEGILGYTDAIYDILKNGVESSYYDYMLTEKESYEED